jgi:C-terminal processing protease CtpA/Prc
VGEFMTSEPDEMIKYADAVQQILRDLDAQLPCGWIVDLSRGSGGNMWPAIAGLGSLIGEGRIGAFLDPDGGLYYWYYRDGSAGVEDYPPNVTVSDPEFQLSAPAAPVAVLINHTTGSAGEAIAIAFRGRPNTLFFGTPSFGFTTGNSTIPLSDGAAIALTQVTFVDRTGQVYGGAIIPDVETYASMNSRDVLDWLLSQPACSNP